MVDSEEAKFNTRSIYIFVAAWCELAQSLFSPAIVSMIK